MKFRYGIQRGNLEVVDWTAAILTMQACYLILEYLLRVFP